MLSFLDNLTDEQFCLLCTALVAAIILVVVFIVCLRIKTMDKPKLKVEDIGKQCQNAVKYFPRDSVLHQLLERQLQCLPNNFEVVRNHQCLSSTSDIDLG